MVLNKYQLSLWLIGSGFRMEPCCLSCVITSLLFLNQVQFWLCDLLPSHGSYNTDKASIWSWLEWEVQIAPHFYSDTPKYVPWLQWRLGQRVWLTKKISHFHSWNRAASKYFNPNPNTGLGCQSLHVKIQDMPQCAQSSHPASDTLSD